MRREAPQESSNDIDAGAGSAFAVTTRLPGLAVPAEFAGLAVPESLGRPVLANK